MCDQLHAENLGRTCIRRASCRSLSVAGHGSYSVTMQREVTAGIRGARYKEPRGREELCGLLLRHNYTWT